MKKYITISEDDYNSLVLKSKKYENGYHQDERSNMFDEIERLKSLSLSLMDKKYKLEEKIKNLEESKINDYARSYIEITFNSSANRRIERIMECLKKLGVDTHKNKWIYYDLMLALNDFRIATKGEISNKNMDELHEMTTKALTLSNKYFTNKKEQEKLSDIIKNMSSICIEFNNKEINTKD